MHWQNWHVNQFQPEVLTAYNLDSLTFGKHYIIPTPFDPRLRERVPLAVSKAAVASGVARLPCLTSRCKASTLAVASAGSTCGRCVGVRLSFSPSATDAIAQAQSVATLGIFRFFHGFQQFCQFQIAFGIGGLVEARFVITFRHPPQFLLVVKACQQQQ